MIRKLAGAIRQYKKDTILTPIFMVGEVVMEVAIPLLMAQMIDQGINGNNGAGDMNFILWMGGLLVLSAVVSLAFGALSGRHAARASAGYAANLRKDMYYRVQTFSFSNIDKFSASSIVTRLTTDVTNVQNAFQMLIRTAVRGPLMLIFSLVMAFRMNASLSWVFLATVPILAIGLLLVSKFAFPIFGRMMKKYDRLNTVVEENLRGIRVVKAFVREDHEVEKFTEASAGIKADSSKAEKILAATSPLMQISMYGTILVISWFGAQMIVGGSMTTGQLMSLISYAGQILMSLMMLSMIFVMMTMSQASMKRIVEILEEDSDITDGQENLQELADGSVEFKDVEFAYQKDGNAVLTDINLSFKSGQTIGILGGTGAGKSSLVQLIPRLYDVRRGQVLVGGRDVRDYNLEALRDGVAMVLQKNVLFSGTIKDNLRWGNENATDEEIVRAAKLACAHEFILEHPEGYDYVIDQGGTNVSGGQKQRLCIARALLKKPKILILDDSTSAVDTHTDAMIRQAFREEIPGTTKIIIAQRVASVQDADQIVVIDGGKIVDVGDHATLLQNSSIYREVYESQQKGDSDEKGGAA